MPPGFFCAPGGHQGVDHAGNFSDTGSLISSGVYSLPDCGLPHRPVIGSLSGNLRERHPPQPHMRRCNVRCTLQEASVCLKCFIHEVFRAGIARSIQATKLDAFTWVCLDWQAESVWYSQHIRFRESQIRRQHHSAPRTTERRSRYWLIMVKHVQRQTPMATTQSLHKRLKQR